MKTEIRIIMADDHPIIRQGLRRMIERDPCLIIVAEAGDGRAALEQIRTLKPDVAILDIDMPEMDGFSVAKAVRQENLPVEIIFLTIHSEEALFQAAMDMGIKAYVLKDSALTDIVNSIRAVAEGQAYISPSLSNHLLSRRRRAADLADKKPGINDLTPTERRILKLIAEDKTTREIADDLFISPRTVETHRTNIARKLELRGSLALVKFAVKHKSEL
jgi:DNA-binding NarL/FixJ family response regulator